MSKVLTIPQSSPHEFMTAKPPSPRLLRLKPAAQYLSMSPGKLRALIQAQEIPIVRYRENAPWLIDVRDLDHWIERNKTTVF
jgi:excisionase family DNA binding protein